MSGLLQALPYLGAGAQGFGQGYMQNQQMQRQTEQDKLAAALQELQTRFYNRQTQPAPPGYGSQLGQAMNQPGLAQAPGSTTIPEFLSLIGQQQPDLALQHKYKMDEAAAAHAGQPKDPLVEIGKLSAQRAGLERGDPNVLAALMDNPEFAAKWDVLNNKGYAEAVQLINNLITIWAIRGGYDPARFLTGAGPTGQPKVMPAPGMPASGAAPAMGRKPMKY